jgi:hypothetical protein
MSEQDRRSPAQIAWERRMEEKLDDISVGLGQLADSFVSLRRDLAMGVHMNNIRFEKIEKQLGDITDAKGNGTYGS